MPNTQQLEILMDHYWGRLSPIHQATSNADTLLGNVFEPLVDLDPRGGVVPGISDRWEMSDDHRKIRFHLRSGVRFSDGTPLTAEVFAKALLDSVSSSDKDSHNPNALDVLYRLKGFSIQNASRYSVQGLRAESNEYLSFEFDQPFRTAIYELTGTRYAAWKYIPSGHRWIGTGPYQIHEHKENERVEYVPNPFSWRKPIYERVIVHGVGNDGFLQLCQGRGDIYVGQSSQASNEAPSRKITFSGGAIMGHFVVDVNGLPGKIFSDSKLRRALQYAIHQVSESFTHANFDSKRTIPDPQFFPPLWAGRLEEKEAQGLIDSGKADLPALVKLTQATPLKLISSRPPFAELQKGLEKLGIRFNTPFQAVPYHVLFDAIYGRDNEYDLVIHGSMIVGSDPDGIYHFLGKHGALAAPSTARLSVQEHLEKARRLTQTENLHHAYSEVSRQILKEVPAIHLSFVRSGYMYAEDRVHPKTSAFNSDRFQFDTFVK